MPSTGESLTNDPGAPTKSSLRKAAVMIRSLPPEAAAALIGRLSAEEAASLRASIAELGEVDDAERTDIADEMRNGSPSRTDAEEDASLGVELQLGADARLQKEEPESDPFQLLRDADPTAIASYLAGEQPQAAALVLSYLPAEIASDVLGKYPEDRQAQLLAQMSLLGEADPTTVNILATDLAAWVRQKSEEQRRRDDRLAAVRGVLSATDAPRRRRLARQMVDQDPSMAERLGLTVDVPAEPKPAARMPVQPESKQAVAKPQPVPAKPALKFEDLERLEGKDLLSALTKIGGRAAVLALAGASDNLLRRVESALSKKAAKQMRSQIARMGQTTLAEVDAAQEALATAAEQVLVARRVRRVASMN